MNANPSQPASPATTVPIDEAELVNANRLPLLLLLVSAAIWLVIASFFGVVGSLKFHSPSLLADCSWLTYGRVRPAYMNSMLYGFCVQAGLAIGLWLISRLGQTPLAQPGLVAVGGGFWNLGVTLGVLGVLAGDSTGFENFEMPGYAQLMLFIGYMLIGCWAIITLHRRKLPPLFVPQWFVLAGMFWFAWIFITAALLLLTIPVRGIAQAIIAWWYSGNLQTVWLGLMGLAAVFYFVPRLVRRELVSRYLALFAFWLLLFFGSWVGIPNSAPVPAWVPALSTVGAVLVLLPMLAVLLNVYQTMGAIFPSAARQVPPGSPLESLSLRFISAGVLGFILSCLANALSGLQQSAGVTDLTWFTVARSHLAFYGFFALVMFGAVYQVVPRLVGIDFPFPRLISAQFWLSVVGVLLIIVPLAIGGVVQGIEMANPRNGMVQLLKDTLPFLRVSTLGDLMLAVAHVLFAVNIVGITERFSRVRATAAYAAATAPIGPVKAQT